MNTQVGRVGKGGSLQVALDPGSCGMWVSAVTCPREARRANMENPGNHLPRGPGATQRRDRKGCGAMATKLCEMPRQAGRDGGSC